MTYKLESRKKRKFPGIFLNGLQKISSSSQKVSKLFRYLKCISESGAERSAPQFVFVKQIVSEVFDLCKGRILQHQLQAFESIDPRLIVNVRSAEIMQVLMHIIENSIQANAHRQDAWIRIEAVAQGKTAVISIYDSGPGLKSWDFDQALSIGNQQNRDCFGGLGICSFCQRKWRSARSSRDRPW